LTALGQRSVVRRRAWCPPAIGLSRAAILISCAALFSSCGFGAPAPPETRREELVETIHGVEVADPYRWLEDQSSAETRAWIDEQNAYAARVLAEAPDPADIRARLAELYRVDWVAPPIVRNDRYFVAKRGARQDLTVLHVRPSPEGTDRVLVDPAALGPDRTLSVQFAAVSADGTLVGYAARHGGEDEIEVRFVDVDSGEHLEDVLPRGRYFGVSIDNDLSGVFYDRQTSEGPRVLHHVFGQDPQQDRVVFGRGYGPEKIIESRLSPNGRYLLISVSHGAAAVKSELYFRDNWTGDQIHTIVNDVDAVFEAAIAGDSLFVLTNWEAPNRRVLVADLRYPAVDRWREIVPEGNGVIEGIATAGGKLLVESLVDVQPRIRVLDPDGRLSAEIEFPTLGAIAADPFSGSFVSASWEGDDAFYAFSSLATPAKVYRYRVSTGELSTWSEPEAPIDSAAFEVRRIAYTSADGTEVPMFLAHRRGLELSGDNPTFLTGYGGFNVSALPAFDRRAIVWMEMGGVWAMPSLRGGGEFGETWHRAGMLENKQNVFDDFIAAAEWLIEAGYTSPDKLAIGGGSNGGLLVGAALTQRPDLFAAVLCTYPLLDMVRYDRFLVAGYWVPEYGSSEDPVQFEYLAGYSPYHRVRSGTRYPAVMLVTGDGDTRVAPLHARKMTALLQAETGSAHPVVLRYDTEAGHSGGRPVSSIIDELTAELRFLLWRLSDE